MSSPTHCIMPCDDLDPGVISVQRTPTMIIRLALASGMDLMHDVMELSEIQTFRSTAISKRPQPILRTEYMCLHTVGDTTPSLEYLYGVKRKLTCRDTERLEHQAYGLGFMITKAAVKQLRKKT
ncbi:hypothetical protein EVAR_24630_1 [Eumeta japonica]|uniref:Uncharacterized protein n=1 Tax=Eumeta variegata TaxID=151549 RepID=A0A4C1V2B8_EUMVA|nr:hypothetical protein EVAR_24630_1 [Eumeta japonica]